MKRKLTYKDHLKMILTIAAVLIATFGCGIYVGVTLTTTHTISELNK